MKLSVRVMGIALLLLTLGLLVAGWSLGWSKGQDPLAGYKQRLEALARDLAPATVGARHER